LRTSLSLSAATKRPIEIFNIRAKRKVPGLRAQHLEAVRAITKICNGGLTGAEIGSTSINFVPQEIKGGEYRIEIGTAGSVSLVLQTIFIPLSTAKTPSTVTITGGTHVPWSPCFHYLALQWLSYLKRIGFDATVEMIRAGFYPKGGGEISAHIKPVREIKPLVIEDRGKLIRVRGISAVGNLNKSIAERQKQQAEKRLSAFPLYQEGVGVCTYEIEVVELPALGQGTMLLLLSEFEHSQCCYYSLGEIGKRAETVADEACDALLHFLETNASVDEYLADQLLLPLAFSKGKSEFSTPRISQHLLTNIEVIKKFLPVRFDVTGKEGEEGIVTICPE
ncbi:MAG: RNA 3'-phosphate cyclase, partial [Planctomycetes bacterium]|nr:RNA 3'-phosphate cyclase [Planctomycetota bacterium]